MRDNIAVFTEYENRYVLMHIVDGRARHIFVYETLSGLDIGTVINCRIENRIAGIDSCFARYSTDEFAFVGKVFKNGSLVPLMYKKEAYADKKAVFTDKITIDGDYVVVTAGADYVKASSRIPEREKHELIERFSTLAADKNVGIIIRTKAHTETDGAIKATEEFEAITKLLNGIFDSSDHLSQYSVLYRPLPAFVKDILLLTGAGIEEVVCDLPEIMEILRKSYDYIIEPVNISDRVSLRLYEDKLLPLCKLYAFDAKISEALSKKVYLKSGAYITIETTEALTAIDVNSAQVDKKASREETFLNINLEATHEIARQICLRNISGMIVVDYINMDDTEDYDRLEKCIKEAIAGDFADCRFVDFTGMKLCEIVRKRSGRSLYRNLRG